MKLRSIFIAAAAGGLVTAVLLLTFPAPGPAPARVGPVAAAPAPPDGVPGRRETGGPDERLAWETQRLADPATGRIPADMPRREQQFAAALPRWANGSAVSATAAKGGADKFAGWGYRGPRNIGGRTRALAIDVADPSYQTLLAGGISGGMWRSTNDGASWTLTTGSTQLHAVSSVAQDTRTGHTQVWYCGTGEYRGNSADGGGAPYRGDGVFRSVDGGISWSPLPSTAGGAASVNIGEWQFVYRLAIDPSEAVSDEIYAAVQGFIERSTDGGASWTRVLGSVNGRASYTDVVVSGTGVVYASLSSDGATRGVFRSTDGVTWADITPSGLTSYGRIVLALAPSDESIVYMLVSDRNGTANAGFYRYAYLSGDGSGAGGAWSDRSAQMASIPGPSGTEAMQCYYSYCQVVTVNPANPNIVYVGGMHLIRSTDGFATNGAEAWIGGWQYTSHHADQHLMVFRPGSSVVAYTGTIAFAVNSKRLPNPPRSWKALFEGQAQGAYRVMIGEVGRAAQANAAVLAAAIALGGSETQLKPALSQFAQIAKQQRLIMTNPSPALMERGEADVFVLYDFNALSFREKIPNGADYQILIPSDGSVTSGYTTIINKFAPHPAAAMLTREYIFSDAGQINLARGNARPVRIDSIKLPADVAAKLIDSAQYKNTRAVNPALWADEVKKLPRAWQKDVIGAAS